MNDFLQKIACELNNGDDIALFTHISPDGDCIGSALALYGALVSMGKNVCVCCDGKVPKNLHSLPWIDRIFEEAPFLPAIAVAIDCADEGRLGNVLEQFQAAKHKIVIDHHGTNTGFGDIDWIDPEAAAVAELIYPLIKSLQTPVTAQIASCLYAALASDTGNFSYSNTRPYSFLMASELLDTGFDMSALSRSMFRVRSKGYAHMLSLVSSQMRFFEEGKIVMALIDKSAMGNYPFESGDHEGIVDFLRDQEGVELAIFAKETVAGGEFKTSLRSLNEVDVAKIASKWSGGGHKRAAGCIIEGTIFSVGASLLEAGIASLKRI